MIYSRGLNSVLTCRERVWHWRTWPSETIWLVCWSYFLLVIHVATLISVFSSQPMPTISLWRTELYGTALHSCCGSTNTGSTNTDVLSSWEQHREVSASRTMGGRMSIYTYLSWYCPYQQTELGRQTPARYGQTSFPSRRAFLAWVLPKIKGDLADQKDCMFRLSV